MRARLLELLSGLGILLVVEFGLSNNRVMKGVVNEAKAAIHCSGMEANATTTTVEAGVDNNATVKSSPNQPTTEEKSATPATDGIMDVDCNKPSTYVTVAIKSGGYQKYANRRMQWRNSTKCAKEYQKANIPYKFLVGLPLQQPLNPQSHIQGARDNQWEIAEAGALRKEFLDYGDVEVLPLRDVYNDIYLKAIQIFQWYATTTTTANQKSSSGIIPPKFLIMHDDEYCVELEALQRLCQKVQGEQRKQGQPPQPANVFAGNYFWDKAAYPQQMGHDKTSFSPYFAGAINILSAPLVHEILQDVDTKFAAMYAPRADDLQIGRWVEKQHNRTDTPPVMYENDAKLLVELDYAQALF